MQWLWLKGLGLELHFQWSSQWGRREGGKVKQTSVCCVTGKVRASPSGKAAASRPGCQQPAAPAAGPRFQPAAVGTRLPPLPPSAGLSAPELTGQSSQTPLLPPFVAAPAALSVSTYFLPFSAQFQHRVWFQSSWWSYLLAVRWYSYHFPIPYLSFLLIISLFSSYSLHFICLLAIPLFLC